jgi:hypothetical protein
MKSILTTCAVLMIWAPASAQLAPYWIADEGCVLHFPTDVQIEARAVPLSLVSEYDPMNGESRFYSFDAEGDLCWVGTDISSPAYPGGGYSQGCNPPLKILDYPLTDGKTWAVEANWSNSEFATGAVTLVGTVVGPATVETGLGILEVVEVRHEFSCTFPAGPNDTETHFLHDQLGDVTGLIELTGCSTVNAPTVTWGGLKSIFR